MKSCYGNVMLFLGCVGVVFLSNVDSADADDKAELAKAAQNPIANMISLPLQNNTNFGVGPGDDTQNILNIQPVYPIELGNDGNLITRTIAPVIYQPEIIEGTGSEFGLGDINATLFFSPADAGKITWGVGPAFSFPTATDDVLGSDKWSAGLSGDCPYRWRGRGSPVDGINSGRMPAMMTGPRSTSFFFNRSSTTTWQRAGISCPHRSSRPTG